jgi:signal peptidase I
MSAATPTTEPEFISARPEFLPLAPTARKPVRSFLQQAIQGLTLVSLALTSYFVISQYLVQSVKVVGRSMVPNLHDSQYYLLNRWVYHLHSPRTRDIVVLRDPADGGFSVKRVIATPGDSVYMKAGRVYVNGHLIEEAYLAPGTMTFIDSNCREQLIHCCKDEVFLLADNRSNSIDSRSYGPVPRANILGQIVQ